MKYELPFFEIPADKLRRLSPCHNIDQVGFLFLVAPLRR